MGLIADLTGGGDVKTSSKPWKPQRKYLTDVFRKAQGLYGQGTNPYVDQGYQGLIDYSQGQGQQTADYFNQQGQQMAGGMNDAMDYYNNMMSGGMKGQAEQLNEFTQQRMNDPALQANIDAATRDTYRNLDENVHTGISGAAAGTGNTSNSRRFNSHAIAERGAADRAGDISANMRSNAYNMAMNQGMQAQNMQNQNANNLMNAGNQGMNYMNQGNMLAQGNYGNIVNAGKGMQQNPWDMLGNYNQMVNGNYGGSTTQSGGGNLMGGAGGLMMGLGGMGFTPFG